MPTQRRRKRKKTVETKEKKGTTRETGTLEETEPKKKPPSERKHETDNPHRSIARPMSSKTKKAQTSANIPEPTPKTNKKNDSTSKR